MHYPLDPIRSEEELQAALRTVDALICRCSLDEGEAAHLDALADLIVIYEDEHYPIG